MRNRIQRLFGSARAFLISYFVFLIAISTVLLSLTASWNGQGSIGLLDAIFTATSAACVTGLMTISTADFTLFGQIVIMATIQFGGLGIILFSTIFVIQPAIKMSLRNRSLIREYYVDQVDFNPGRIVRSIVVLTAGVQAVGALVLYYGFSRAGVERPIFASLFHAVSAFCNAGFSLFRESLEAHVHDALVTVPIMVLTVLGGIGFVVLDDLMRREGRVAGRRLTLHSRLVVGVTASLISLGALLFFVFEYGGAFSEFTPLERASAALFQSVTTRTAGFNTVPQELLSYPARTLSLALMFIGGAPGSIAGGIKVTTFALVLFAAVFGTNRQGEIEISDRRIPAELIAKAHGLFFKALGLLFLAVLALTLSERDMIAEGFAFSDVVFESVSAFATVGLSTGITSELSAAGRVVIIFTMFAGRIGLIALAMPRSLLAKPLVHYPTGEVIVG